MASSGASRLARMIRPRFNLIGLRKPLPRGLLIPTAGHAHLYQIGLTFFPPEEAIERSFLFNPFFRLFMELLYLGRSCASLFVVNTRGNHDYFVKAGDYMYFIRAKTHINIAATQYMMIGISIMVCNYIRYRFNTYPTFFVVYDFLSGKRTPAQCGFRRRENVIGLVAKAHAALKLVRLSNWLVFYVSFVLSFLPSALHYTWLELLFYGLPWSIVFAVSSFYTFSTYFWNLAYFYILCHFIKIQLRETNELAATMVVQKKRHNRQVNIAFLQTQYLNIINHVRSYNTTYWSTYLFLVVTFLSTFNNTILYTALYVDLNIVIQMSLFYACLNSCSAVFFVLNTASVVYTEFERSRNIANSIYVDGHRVFSYRQLYKVNTNLDEFVNNNN